MKQKPFIPKQLMANIHYIRMAKYIGEKISAGDPLSLGLWLICDYGFRLDEACSAKFGFSELPDDFAELFSIVVPDSMEGVQNGAFKYCTGRSIPMHPDSYFLLSKVVEKRFHDANREYDPDMPIVCSPTDPTKPCSPEELSDAAKELLLHIGLTEEILNWTKEALDYNAANDEDKYHAQLFERDPAVSLLRCVFANCMKRIGMSDEQIMYLIGHMKYDCTPPEFHPSDFEKYPEWVEMEEKILAKDVWVTNYISF